VNDPQPIDDELVRMTGNAKAAEAVKESLRKLSEGAAGPELADMAKDLLAGRAALRDVGRSPVYGAALSEAFATFTRWRDELSAQQRADIEKQARDQFGDAIP
jgi:hypothetical protein